MNERGFNMVGSVMQKAFVRVLVLIILNLEFWLFSLAGLLIFGFGPALRTIYETFLNHKFRYQEYSFKESWRIYKKYFWLANLHFYVFFLPMLFVFYDLYLTSQMKTPWILPVIITMIVLEILIPVVGMYTLSLESNFDVDFKNAIKLAFAEFFVDFSGLIKFVAGTAGIIAVTFFFSGLILFISISAIVIWCQLATKNWIYKVESQIE